MFLMQDSVASSWSKMPLSFLKPCIILFYSNILMQTRLQSFELHYPTLEKKSYMSQQQIQKDLISQEGKFRPEYRDLWKYPMKKQEVKGRMQLLLECSQCEATLRFLKATNSDQMSIVNSKSLHRHPVGLVPRLDKFGYPEGKKELDKLLLYEKDIEEWLDSQPKLKFRLFRDRNNKNIEAVVFTSLWNLSLSLKYPEVLYLEAMSIDPLLPNSNLKRLLLIYTYGQKCQIVILGYSIYTKKEQLSAVVDCYIELAAMSPKTIVTNLDIQVKQKVTNVLNGAIILSKLEQFFQLHLFHETSLINCIADIINEESTASGVAKLAKFSETVENITNPIIKQALQKTLKQLVHHNLCYWKLPNVFLGSKKIPQELAIHGLLENSQIFSENPADTLEGLFKYAYDNYVQEETYYKISPEEIQKTFNDAKLKQVRESIEPKPFQMFFLNYLSSYECKYEPNCHCKDSVVMGMPCKHKILRDRQIGINYVESIADRWIIDKTHKSKCAQL